MPKSRRKFVVTILKRVALGLVLFDVLLYIGVVARLDKAAASELQRFTALRRGVREEEERVARLERFESSLPDGRKQVQLFQRKYVPPRRRGFSRASRLVRQLTQQSGLRLSNVAYKLDLKHDEPLERLGIEVTVEGSFTGLLNFAHALETAGEFVLIREFSFEPVEGGALELRLGAELYLAP